MQAPPSEVERIRAQPQEYIGAQPTTPLILLWGLLANSVDEHLHGHCNRISVHLRDDGAIVVEDDGRGIPVETRNGVCAATYVFTSAHIRFRDSRGPSHHPQLDALSLPLVAINALSSWLEFNTFIRQRHHFQYFSRGVPHQAMRDIGPTTQTGLTIVCLPDPTFFPTSTPLDVVLPKIRELSNRFPNLELHLSPSS
jgi:DNA gyrase subunit B